MESEEAYSTETLVGTSLTSPEQTMRPDAYGLLPLHWASRKGDVSAIGSLLRAGADPNAIGGWWGSTALFVTRSLECAQLLLRAGADPNSTDRLGETPIIEMFHQPEMVGLLLSYGAYPCVPRTSTHSWSSPLGWAANRLQDVKPDDGRTETWAASLDLLLEAGLDIDLPEPQYFGRTALMLALVNRNAPLAALLINRGARLDSVDNNLCTVFHFAAGRAQLECIEILRRANICGINPDRPDAHGLTPMHYLDLRMQVLEDDMSPGHKRLTEEEYWAFTQLVHEIRERNVVSTQLRRARLVMDEGGDEAELKSNAQYLASSTPLPFERRRRSSRGADREDLRDEAMSDDDEFYDAEF